jgi:sugar-specific transcriptional regulator TrmB
MTWFGIIKNTKLRAGSKVTTNLGIDSKQEEDGPCKRKVEEYIKKVIEYSKKQYLYMQTIPVSHKIIEEGTRNLSEEVCCKILELLNRVKPTQFLTKKMMLLILLKSITKIQIGVVLL